MPETLSTVLLVISAVLILDSLFIIFFPKQTRSITLKIAKNKNLLKKIGVIELITGVIIFLISVLVRGY